MYSSFRLFFQQPIENQQNKPLKEKIKKILVTEHDFSEERINNALDKLQVLEENKKQKTMKDFF